MAALPLPALLGGLLACAGLLVLALRPHRRASLWICVLLVLQGALTAAYGALVEASEPAGAMLGARLALWATIVLPLATVLFAHALFPPGSRLARAAPAATALVTLAALVAFLLEPTLFLADLYRGPPTYAMVSGPLLYGLAGAVLLAQAYAVARAARHARPDAAGAEHARLVALAFSLLPLYSGAFFLTFLALRDAELGPRILTRVLLTFAAGALILAALRKMPLPRSARLGLGALASLGLVDGVFAADPRLFSFVPGYERSILVLRVAFAALIVAGAVRFGMADAGAADRAHAARVVRVAGVALAAGASALLALGLLGANVLGGAVALAVAAAVPAAGWRAGAAPARRLAERLLLPPDDPRAVAERARTYAAAVAAARGAGAEGERLLARMRADLGISEQEHALLVQGVASRDEERYRRVEVLGRGSTAQVELAMDEVAGKRVVVKRFKGLRDPASVLKEARALAAVRHPRIVAFLEVDRRGDDVYLVLAFAEGGSARQLLDREGPLPPERALPLARDLLEGLDALHAAGLVHCDVKLENLLLDAGGRGILGDFGSARFGAPDLADATLTGAQAEGSLSTVAPEALRGATPAPTRDVYAAGAVLYRLLTGEHYVRLADATVFEARERILLDPPRLPHPRVPAAIEPVLRRALAKRPGERYQTAREMLDALDKAPIARTRG